MRALTLLCVLALIAACTDPESGSTTTENPPASSSSSTSVTSTSLAAESSTTSTTIVEVEPQIDVFGSARLFSPDGEIHLEGMVDGQADVTTTFAEVVTRQSGEQTAFSADFLLEPGEHLLELFATNESGLQDSAVVAVTVDPSFSKETAYLREIDVAGQKIVADYVEWLVGEEALLAAREDGEIGPEEDLPGDFYIRTRNPRLRTLELSDSAVFVLQACYQDEGPCVVQEAVDLETLGMLSADPESGYDLVGWWWYGLGELPFSLTLDGDSVIQLSELYVP